MNGNANTIKMDSVKQFSACLNVSKMQFMKLTKNAEKMKKRIDKISESAIIIM